MEHARTFVFKEINIANSILFLWYKLASEESDNYIIPDKILTPEQHRLALMLD